MNSLAAGMLLLLSATDTRAQIPVVGDAVPGLVAVLPNPATTPGAIDGAVTQSNIDSTICLHVPGIPSWARAHRPPVDYTETVKKAQLGRVAPGIPLRYFEEDHLVPLELGGHPTDTRNLWPEPWEGEWGAKTKDRLENHLHRLVCGHRLGLAEAQSEIATNWIAAYGKYCRAEQDCPAYRN